MESHSNPIASPPVLRTLRRCGVAALAAVCLTPAGAAHAATTTVHASPAETSHLLFVAGDVRRLSRTPSGTVDGVLEKVLQQLYRDDPGLAPADATAAIGSLRPALAGAATSTATLAAQPGNQRVLAILAAFERSGPAANVRRAVTEVADQALSESSSSARTLGRPFNATADSLSTLLYGGFSPAATLRDTADLAATNAQFGRARDALWAAASHESVFDGGAALLAHNPALADASVRALTSGLAADGSLTTSVADTEELVRQGMQAVDAQGAVAMQDHTAIARACPGLSCQAAIDGARDRGAAARETIAARQASLTAAGGVLALSDERYGAAIEAEAQAAAQVANAVNSYYAATDYGQYAHAAADVAGLLSTLAVAEFDPAAAVTGVLNVVGDVVGVAITGPDANALILQGLQGVSQQLSAFAAETADRFRGLDARLEGLTRQVGSLAGQLSAQLAEAQTQLTGLGTALATLQGSVDQLHSEIQLLFAQGARNDLGTIVNQSIGYETLNGERLPRTQFAISAGALFQDATSTAFTPTVLNAAPAFDAATAFRLGDLDPNVNFFALFPGRVVDAPASVAWPAPFDDSCPGGDVSRGLCLPDPDFWAASSRAFAQLLLENRDYVTPARLTQLDAALSGGRSLDRALGRIAAHDGDHGTDSKLFNAALDYYSSWVGRDADRASGPPALLQALRAERERYLSTVRPAGLEPDGPWIDLYAGANQPLGNVRLFGLPSLNDIPSTTSSFTIPNLRPAPAAISWLPVPVLNAVRLGLGDLKVTWNAHWFGGIPAGGNIGDLIVRFDFAFAGHPTAAHPKGFTDSLGYLQVQRPFAVNCASGPGSAADADASIAIGWDTFTTTCSDFSSEIQQAAVDPNSPRGIYFRNTDGFAAAVADLTPQVDARLRTLQAAALGDVLNEDDTLTRGGGSRATDVEAAAERVGGAQQLVNGYVALGLPQALATDDTLHGLVAGDGANALAAPFGDDRRAAPADTVPGQVASFFAFMQVQLPQFDPLTVLGQLLAAHQRALTSAIKPYIDTGRSASAGQSATDGGPLDETSPLVSSTIDRLELTRAVLAAEPDSRVTPPVAPAPPTTPTPAPAAATPAPAPASPAPARARIIRAPRAHGRTITATIGCLSGTCRITTTTSAGLRRLTPFSIPAGSRRSITIRLSAAGRRSLARRARLRVRVRIALAGTTRPLANATVTLRETP